MLKFLLKIFNLTFLLGYLENGIFPSKLSDEEETKLISELFIEDKHDEARKKLILHNLRLVGHIAKKYESKDQSYDDLISIGTIGLIKAIDSFKKDKNVRIATYASRCIENEILMVLRGNKKYSKDISITDAIGQDKEGEEILLEDIISSNQEGVDEKYARQQKIAKLRKYLSVLDDKEYQIISLRYGLNDTVELTQKEIGKKYHISRSYVSRIEKRALIKLYQEFKKHNELD